jgi:hypothetical protein
MPVILYRRLFPSVRNITRKSLHFSVFFFEEHNLPSPYRNRGNFQARLTRGSAFSFRILSPLWMRTPVPYHSVLHSFSFEVRCGLMDLLSVLCKVMECECASEAPFFSYSPDNDMLQDVDEICSENVAGNLRCIRKPWSVIFKRGF